MLVFAPACCSSAYVIMLVYSIQPLTVERRQLPSDFRVCCSVMKAFLISGLGCSLPGSQLETTEINTHSPASRSQTMTKPHTQDPLRASVGSCWHQVFFLFFFYGFLYLFQVIKENGSITRTLCTLKCWFYYPRKTIMTKVVLFIIFNKVLILCVLKLYAQIKWYSKYLNESHISRKQMGHFTKSEDYTVACLLTNQRESL